MSVPLEPVAAYDLIAPGFAKLAEQRRKYLDAVDGLVISAIAARSRSLLDVGAGDGIRSNLIAQRCGISELTLVEPSVAMQRSGCGDARFRTMRAEELHLLAPEFDVILCLWNVLGHIFPECARLEVLRQFSRLLSPRGRIFIDVHHRYNVHQYGTLRTSLRFLRDRLSGHDNGDVQVSWDAGETRCLTKGHVFTRREIEGLYRSAGLKIENRFVVDYLTGQQRRWSPQGHLLYVLRA
jgi:2-polyprenyl-3-methyl-5-hydroxy-6-metoxy-1,4-benzoquinol methylase